MSKFINFNLSSNNTTLISTFYPNLNTMALHYLESESEAYSKVSSDSLEENIDLAAKFRTNLPNTKRNKPKRNRSAFIIFSSEVS